MKKLIFALLLSISSVLNAQIRFYDVKTLSNYQQVLEKAINEDKLMFLALYQNGDAFYQMQKDNIFANQQLANIYEQSVPLAVGITSEMGSRIAESIGVDSFPTFYYFKNDETLLLVKSGYQSAQDLATAFATAEDLNKKYEVLRNKYSEGTLAPSEWIQLLDIYALNNDFIETEALAFEYFSSQSQAKLLVPTNASVLEKYAIRLETKYPELVIKNRAKLGESFDYDKFYNSAYDFNFDLALANSDTVLLEKIVSVLIPSRPKDEADTQELIFETRKVFASETRNFKLWQEATIVRSASIATDDSAKAEYVFEEAFEIADNFNTEEAQTSARELAKRAYDLHEDFRYKMLEGYMAYLLKDYEEAQKLVDLAASITDNANNKRKATSLSSMISRELEKQKSEDN